MWGWGYGEGSNVGTGMGLYTAGFPTYISDYPTNINIGISEKFTSEDAPVLAVFPSL